MLLSIALLDLTRPAIGTTLDVLLMSKYVGQADAPVYCSTFLCQAEPEAAAELCTVCGARDWEETAAV